MSTGRKWSFGMVGAALATGLPLIALVFALAGAANAAPSEEDIGASTPPSAARVHVHRAASEAPAQERSAAETSDVPPPLIASPPQLHATFPYTIRPGDSLGSIASQFGVSIAELTRVNHLGEDADLIAGQALRIPNPFLAREHELTTEIDRLSLDKQAADQRVEKAESALASERAQVEDLTAAKEQYSHNLRMLPWWRTVALTAIAAAVLMLGVMMLALFEWWILRNRFRAVAEMNESLRRLDFKYKTALAKGELRLQELYGRRRRGIQEGQERLKLPEEAEIEELNRQLKEVLEHHLERLGPPSESTRRAHSRERVGGIGSPVAARSERR
jgi:LysM repeat protein